MNGGALHLNVGDVLTLKKPHPCGSYEWQVSKVGADIRLICMGCGKKVIIPRYKLRRVIRKVNGVEIKHSS